MRSLVRRQLGAAPLDWLKERQAEVDAVERPDTTGIWRTHRPAMNSNGIRDALRLMVGKRERCVYCGDSVATDVEHYKPKSRFPSTMFVWPNFLWSCRPCNGKKGVKFPVMADGTPLLIDPTAIDPWDHLYFVRETGELAPRFDPISGAPDPFGEATLDPKLLRINAEAVSEARRRAWRALRREVQHFLNAPDQEHARNLLVEAFEDTERPDVAIWCLEREGGNAKPFSRLRAEYSGLVVELLTLLAAPRHMAGGSA